MRDLALINNRIVDVEPLQNLLLLETLRLFSNEVSDISALRRLTRLTTLTLNGNQIVDISSLAGMRRLRQLGHGCQLQGRRLAAGSPDELRDVGYFAQSDRRRFVACWFEAEFDGPRDVAQ